MTRMYNSKHTASAKTKRVGLLYLTIFLTSTLYTLKLIVRTECAQKVTPQVSFVLCDKDLFNCSGPVASRIGQIKALFLNCPKFVEIEIYTDLIMGFIRAAWQALILWL